MEMLNAVVTEVKRQLPQFNRGLLLNLRQDMIVSIETFLDNFMRYIAAEQIEEIEYEDYCEVQPKQLLDHLTDNKNKNYKLDVTNSSYKLMEYKFHIKDGNQKHKFSLFYYLPYLKNQAVEISGLNYYPIFTISNIFMFMVKPEEGNSFQHAGVAFPFYRTYTTFFIRKRDKLLFSGVTSNRQYTATVMKINAHHNLKNKNTKLPPAIIYLLAKFGFYETLKIFEFEKDEITFETLIDENDTLHEYFSIPGSIVYIKVKKESLRYTDKKRFVAGLIVTLKNFPVNEPYMYSEDDNYYKLNLGQWIQGKDAKYLQQKNQALEHLKTMDLLVDMFSKQSLNYEGIDVNNSYDLIIYMFYNIHSLVHLHRPNDLFRKRINLLPFMLHEAISSLNHNIISKDKLLKKPMQLNTFRTIFPKNEILFVKNIKSLPHVFMTENSLSNDNWLLTVGARKYKYNKAIYMSAAGAKKKKNKGGALRLDPTIFAHHSQFVVESPLNYPSGNPCIGGTLNIFNHNVDVQSGLLKKPDNNEQLDPMFKTK